MKNILLIIPYGSVGGIERLALNFYNSYKGLGYTVKVIKIIKLDSDIIDFDADEIALSEIDFIAMSFTKRLFFYLKAPFLIRQIIKKQNITHTLSFGDMPNVFSSLTFTNEKKVASIHSLKSVELLNKSFLNTVFKLAYQTTYNNFDKVVCISQDIKRDLIEKCSFKFQNKLHVIYNPHDVVAINEKAKEAISINEEAIFANDTILFLGRLSYAKAPWHLIKSFCLLLNNHPGLKLVFIGDGDTNVEKYCKDLVNQLQIEQSVFFLGRKSNPYKYLKKAKVLALSSYYEGTPNVIVEAIALEIPVVSSNCTNGIKELMSFELYEKQDQLIITDSGIITPSFFEGKLTVPDTIAFIDQEQQFALALEMVLKSDNVKNNLIKNKQNLLKKFDLYTVIQKYLD